jgi:ABC-type dipeptide/oligopeptide/nickel transport system permease component
LKLIEYIGRRLALLVFVLFGVSVLVFLLSHIVADPVYLYISEKTNENAVNAIIHKYQLDAPLPVQYIRYVQALLSGDWGYSRRLEEPVLSAIATRFPFTVELAIASIILTIAIGIPLGILSALKNNKIPDHLSRIFALVGVSLPVFWLGLVLKVFFFFDFKQWGLPSLPSGGAYDQILALQYPAGIKGGLTGLPILDTLLAGNYVMFGDSFVHLILPAVTLAFISIGNITRIMRSSMLEVLRQDYIILARSKGLAERVVIYRHALKNALIPTVTLSGLIMAGLLGGAPITEFIFQWPGVGQMAVGGILSNDLALIMGFTLIVAIIVVISNLVVDILYAYLDPRVKY